MKNKQTSTDITRRKALKIGAVALVGAAAFGRIDALAAETKGKTLEEIEEALIKNK